VYSTCVNLLAAFLNMLLLLLLLLLLLTPPPVMFLSRQSRCAVEAKRSPRPWDTKPSPDATAAAAAAAAISARSYASPPNSPSGGRGGGGAMSDAQLLRDCGLHHVM
jgi:hypothetical protein